MPDELLEDKIEKGENITSDKGKKDEEVVLEIIDDPKEAGEGTSKAEDKGAKTELKVDDAIAELKNKLKKETEARREAERRAREAENATVVAKVEVDDTNMHLIKGAIESVKRDEAILKSSLAAALAKQDYEAVADIQGQLSKNAVRLTQLEAGKIDLEKKPKPEVKKVPEGDAVEKFVARLSPKSAEWVRNHPECVTDPEKNQLMLGAHNLAMGKRIKVDTPEYFAFIEKTIQDNDDTLAADADTQEDTEKTAEAEKPSGGRRVEASPAAAPVSRTASTSGGNRPNVIRLTAAEKEMAELSGLSYKEYWENKVALQKAGRIN